MQSDWQGALDRWQSAGLIDGDAAQRIRSFEQTRSGLAGLRWPTIVALAFGGLMLGAGVLLLFVAAHWDTLSPGARFALVLTMLAVFHGAGAAARSQRKFGDDAARIGNGIARRGNFSHRTDFQFYQEHWPSGVMLWAAGAWAGWWLRRDWVQFAFAAVLTPFWLAGEWAEAYPGSPEEVARVLCEGSVLLFMTYLAARTRKQDDSLRRVLVWIGAIGLLPASITLAAEFTLWRGSGGQVSGSALATGYLVAFGLPLALAWWLRRGDAWMNVVAAVWVFLLGAIARTENPWLFMWCALGAAGMIAWGVRDGRSERVNMGMIGFAITLLFFYFSQVMDKLGRSASLIGMGLLFLAGGWGLERIRRRLVTRAREAT